MSEREGWTPGPWEHQEISDAYTHIIRGAGNRYIGSAPQSLGEADEANARLMSAAPTLFSELSESLAILMALRALLSTDTPMKAFAPGTHSKLIGDIDARISGASEALNKANRRN